jgi:hypothetical protein
MKKAALVRPVALRGRGFSAEKGESETGPVGKADGGDGQLHGVVIGHGIVFHQHTGASDCDPFTG